MGNYCNNLTRFRKNSGAVFRFFVLLIMQHPLHGDAIEAAPIPTGRRGAPTGIAASSSHDINDQRPMGSDAGGAGIPAESATAVRDRRKGMAGMAGTEGMAERG
jgi:hypothetical protein